MLDGIININKPKNMTSHDVVSIIRKRFNMRKVGHGGTLDPMAEGVLPIFLGRGTKMVPYLSHEKNYICEMTMGLTSDTLDIWGKIVEEDVSTDVDESEVVKALESMKGTQTQEIPAYSAAKHNGKKLYEYARAGEAVPVKTKEVTIYDIQLLQMLGDGIKFYVNCSEGTFIRTLCRDLGERLGTYGVMSRLIRTKSSGFAIEDSVLPDRVEERDVLPMQNAVTHLKKVQLPEDRSKAFANGLETNDIRFESLDNKIVRVCNQNDFLGIGVVKNSVLYPEKVIKG